MTPPRGPDLVTGATGFIGGHLALRLLRQGRAVRLLCRKGSEGKLSPELRAGAEIVWGDLTDGASLRAATLGAARVFHCAGHVSDWGTEAKFHALNVQAVRVLLEGAREAQVSRFIHLSSIAAFGTPSPANFDDQSPYGNSSDAYSRTKALGEKLVFDFGKETGLPVTVLRPAVVYGPGSTWLDEPLKMIKLGKMALLGGGRGTCHPCYIENLVDAMQLAAEHPRAVGQGFIVADDDPITFREYFNAVADIAGQGPIRRSIPLPIAHVVAAGFEFVARLRRSEKRPMLTQTAIAMVTTKSRMSMGKVREELDFRPRYGFRSAMANIKSLYTRRDSPRTSAAIAT